MTGVSTEQMLVDSFREMLYWRVKNWKKFMRIEYGMTESKLCKAYNLPERYIDKGCRSYNLSADFLIKMASFDETDLFIDMVLAPRSDLNNTVFGEWKERVDLLLKAPPRNFVSRNAKNESHKFWEEWWAIIEKKSHGLNYGDLESVVASADSVEDIQEFLDTIVDFGRTDRDKRLEATSLLQSKEAKTVQTCFLPDQDMSVQDVFEEKCRKIFVDFSALPKQEFVDLIENKFFLYWVKEHSGHGESDMFDLFLRSILHDAN